MYSSDKAGRAFLSLTAVLALLLCFALPVFAADIPAPTPEFYVNDFSGVLSTENKTYIVDANVKLREKTGAQVVVVTMKTLSGADLNTFATELFRRYGIGDAQKNNGVLLLVITDDRDIRIEVGYGLEGAINDARAGRLLDEYVVPYLSENKWDEGIVNGFNAILQQIKTEYGIEDTDTVISRAPVHYEKEEQGFFERYGGKTVAAMIISLIVGLISGAFEDSTAGNINLAWAGMSFIYFVIQNGFLAALVSLFANGVFQLIGYAITSPGSGSSGYSGGSSGYSGGSSGHSSSHSSYSGGGGRSGGGGASRKFR